MSSRFTEEDAQRIFARAAERQHRRGPSDPDALSLDELKEIGEASGLDPEIVAAVAAEFLRAPLDVPVRTFLGAPTEARVTRIVPGRLTDDVWERVVEELRATFAASGTPTDVGRRREWSYQNGSAPLEVALVPVSDGVRLSLDESRADQPAALWGLAGIFGPMVLLVAGMILFGNASPALWVAPILFTLVPLAFAVGMRVHLGRWARRRDTQLQAVADRIELLLRDTLPEGAASATDTGAVVTDDARAGTESETDASSGGLSLDALPDALDLGESLEDVAARTRRSRRRS